MVFPVAIALMGQGVREKMRADEQDQIDRDANRAWIKEQRDNQRADWEFQKGERARMLKNRDAVAAAAQDVAPTDGTTFQPQNDDEGNPMPANPTEGTYLVDGKRYASKPEADAAAAAANTPQAATERVSRALMSQGDIHGAQQLRTGLRQEKVADSQIRLHDMQIDEAARKFANAKFDESLAGLSSFDDLANMVTRMGGSAQGITLQAKKSPDGKTVTLMRVMPDGSLQPTAQSFDNTARGLETAKASFSKSIGPHDKITWLHQQALEKQQADALAEQKRHHMATEAIQRYAASAKASGAVASPQDTPESTFDRKTAAEIAKDTVKKEAEAEAAAGKPMSGAAMAKRVDEITSAMFQAHANRFITGTVQRELQLAQGDPAAYAAAYAKASKVLPPTEIQRLGFRDPNARPAPAPGTPAATIASAPAGSVSLQDGKWVAPGGASTAEPAPAPRAAMSGNGAPAGFQDMLAKEITAVGGKQRLAVAAKEQLPTLQSRIQNINNLLALPTVKGPIRKKLQDDLAATSNEAEMMVNFLAGNPDL